MKKFILKDKYRNHLLCVYSELVSRVKFSGFEVGITKNGLYLDNESPLRLLSHLIIFSVGMYQLFKKENYLDEAKVFYGYLIKQLEVHDDGNIINFRYSKSKDNTNGVIGYAWLFEAIYVAKRYLEINNDNVVERYLSRDLELQQIWNVKDNNHLRSDLTMNHQLWLTYALQGLNHNYDKSILFQYVKQHKNGCFMHLSTYAKLINRIKRRVRIKNNTIMLEKEIGYHLFYLYALAGISAEKKITNKYVIEKAINFMYTEHFMKSILKNKYAIPYNKPGVEMFAIEKALGLEISHNSLQLLDKQIEYEADINNLDILELARWYELFSLELRC